MTVSSKTGQGVQYCVNSVILHGAHTLLALITADLNDVVICPLSNVVRFTIAEANKIWTFKYFFIFA